MTNTRTRKGCLTCRSRKRKCDNNHPRCESCETRDLTCRWGLKASFHPSRQLELTDREREHLACVEARRQRHSSAKFVNSTEHIYRYFRDSNVTNADLLSSLEVPEGGNDAVESSTVSDTLSVSAQMSAAFVSEAISTFPATSFSHLRASRTGYDHDDHVVVADLEPGRHSPTVDAEYAAQINAQDGVRDLPGVHASTSPNETDAQYSNSAFTPQIAPTTEDEFDNTDGSHYDFPFSLGLAVSYDPKQVTATSPWTEPEFPLSSDETLEVLQSFITYTATWCETTDTCKNISVVFAHDIVAHKICMAAALALTCRQRSVFHNSYKETALKLYQYTIQSLITQNPDHADPLILTACILLCVYEMISADVADWRRHLKGCAGLFIMRGWNGSSTGLVKACFWAFARIDIWASFVSEKQTLIPIDQWVNDDSLERAASVTTPDDYCNLCIVAFARTINCIAKLRQATATDHAYNEAEELCNYLRQWWDLRPNRVRPVLRFPTSPQNIFPKTIFTSASAICGNTFYHCSIILLLKVLQFRHRTEPPFLHPHSDPTFHALEIGGISVSNADHANWVNQLQPLYIAGQTFAENPDFPPGLGLAAGAQKGIRVDSQPGSWRAAAPEKNTSKYAAEKFALLKQLQVIQAATGWKTDERARELRHLWGLQ